MSKKILILGAGRVGGFMAEDLAEDADFEVTVADRDALTLEQLQAAATVETTECDLTDAAALTRLAADHDVVLGALPGRLGFNALAAVIEAGRPVVDISFFPEDARTLDAAARERGVPAVVDFGVAPGLCGLIAGLEATRLDRRTRLSIQVGGLPLVRVLPWEYRAVFSPDDVIEEYTRPARVKRGGEAVTVPALSGLETFDWAGIGTLESFITDGLRTLLDLDFPEMEERTLRYPGHAERMRLLRDAGFFGTEPIEVGDVEVRPRDLAAKLLFPQWKLTPGEGEFTLLRVEVEGEAEGAPVHRIWDLLDCTDAETGHTSMARTTGLPAVCMVRLLARGGWSKPGVNTAEQIGADAELAKRLLETLAERGIEFEVLEKAAEAESPN